MHVSLAPVLLASVACAFHVIEPPSDEWDAADLGIVSKLKSRPRPDLSYIANKWLYFRGDSTTRQLVEQLLIDTGDWDSKGNFKEYVRSHCKKQEHRKRYSESLGFAPCWLNEKTCHWHLPTLNLTVTYDWKHFVLEDREEYLYSKVSQATDPAHDFYGGKMPDVLIVGGGVHPCFHTHTLKTWIRTATNISLMNEFIADVPRLIDLKRSVYKGPLVWVEAGIGIFSKKELPAYADAYHECVRLFNAQAQSALRDDSLAAVVPRYALEEEWSRHHHEHTGIHRSPECVAVVADNVMNSTRLLLRS